MAAATKARTRLLTEREVQQEYGIPAGTLSRWRCERRGPNYVKTVRRVRYWSHVIDAWLKANTVVVEDGAR